VPFGRVAPIIAPHKCARVLASEVDAASVPTLTWMVVLTGMLLPPEHRRFIDAPDLFPKP
jgi:hypothetical protein